MNAADPKRLADPGDARRLRRLAPLFVVLVALLLGGLALVLHRDYRAELGLAERVAFNVTVGIEREIAALLEAQERAYSMLVHAWSHEHGLPLGPAADSLTVTVAEYADRMPELLALAVVDRDGRVLANSRGDARLPQAPVDARATQVAVAPPLRDPVSGRWVLPLALNIDHGPLQGGRVVGLLDVGVLVEIMASRELGTGGGISVLHTDGFVVARSDDFAASAGSPVRGREDFRALVEGPAMVRRDVVSPFDGIERIGLFRRMGGYPLIVAAGMARHEALASWYGFAAMGSLVALALLALGALLFGSLVRANARQRRLLAELRASTEQLTEAQAIARLGHWRLEVASERVECSDEVYRILGRERGVAGADRAVFQRSVHADDVAGVMAALAATVEHGRPLDHEHRIVRPDGSVRYVHTYGERQAAEDGGVEVVGTIQDVTDEALLRERLRKAETEYRFMFERSPLPMWVVDADSLRFVEVNEAALRHYGYTREQLLGMGLLDVRPEEDVPAVLRALRTETAEQLAGRVWRHRRSDGSISHVATWAVETEFAGRRARIILNLDVTDRLRAESERAESELRFSTVAQATSDAIWDYDVGTDTLWWSEGLKRICGLDPSDMPSLGDWEQRVHPDDHAGAVAGFEAALASPERREWEATYRFRVADGSYREFHDHGVLLRAGDGSPRRAIGGMSDITERRRREEDLRLLRRAIEAADNGVLIVGGAHAELTVVYANPAFERMLGVTEEALAGHPLRASVHGAAAPALETLRRAIMSGPESQDLLQIRRADGRLATVEVRVAPVRDGDQRVTHQVAVLLDVTEREQAQARLAFQEAHDSLTSLPNRGSIASWLEAAIRRARSGGTAPTVLFIGLDHFTLINDSLGHQVGDQVLRGVAQRLIDAVPEADVVGRFGGDEFVVVLSDAAAPVAVVIDRITRSLARPLEVLGTVHYLTCSIGYSRHPVAGDDAESLLKTADLAMYQAKQRGRNCVVAYSSELTAEVSERLHLVSRLREALANDEFELHFQPQYGVDGSRPIGLEALIRWRHPERGLVLPGEFIRVCEDSGLIVPLGRWVLREAVRCHLRLREAGFGGLRIAVNVSAAQFQHGALMEDVDSLLRSHEVATGAIELELTESVLLERPEAAIAVIGALKSLGVAVSIDDFGTGYSSLSYLRRLPVDTLKIDRSFVADLPDDVGAVAICDTIIDLAHSFGRTVVAEGVETAEQLAWLRAKGCDGVQGYLLARPMPFDEVLVLLRAAETAETV